LANIINGTDTGSGGLITTGDSSDELQIQTAETTAITITSGQQSAFIAGTAAAPAVTTTGDLNTGIYFPAADNIGFATGGTIRGRWTTDGLCFGSDTAAANALDDYEEGTWTPGFLGAGTAGTYTVTVNSATYTKIGRVVILDADFGFSAASGGTAYAVITGMPFNVGNQALGDVSFQNVNVNDATVNISCQRVSAGTNTRIYFTGTVDNTTGEAIPASSFSTSSTVQITITYTAA
jgi:hypothetical protein